MVVVAFGAIVAMGVHRPDVPVFAPSPVAPRPPADSLVGPELVTIDARDADRWQFFSFARGSVIERPGPRDWDLAFSRFKVIVNGGPGFAGDGGIADIGEVAFDTVRVLPDDGYVVNTVRSDTVNHALRRWYSYSYLSHRLSPRPRVYAVRTADGRYAKVEFTGYYCVGGEPGCVTLRYVFQGGGGGVVVRGAE
jgi:hypothetical protein